MKREDSMSFRQYMAAVGVSLFSPVTRLLPKAVLEPAGFSGWIAPLAALPLLLGLVWLMGRLLTLEGRKVGLGDALLARLGCGCCSTGAWSYVPEASGSSPPSTPTQRFRSSWGEGCF